MTLCGPHVTNTMGESLYCPSEVTVYMELRDLGIQELKNQSPGRLRRRHSPEALEGAPVLRSKATAEDGKAADH